MFGQAHSQAGILIEPTAEHAIDIGDEDQLIKFRNLIWLVHSLKCLFTEPMISRPVINEANKESPSFSKIYKEMILVTDKARPLPRAGKDMVLKKAALKEYHNEIETLLVSFLVNVRRSIDMTGFRYASVESTDKSESIAPPESWEDILSLQDKSSRSASGVGHDTGIMPMACHDYCQCLPRLVTSQTISRYERTSND